MSNLRIKTSFDLENKLIELQTGFQFSTKASVMRLAIGVSLKEQGDPRISNGVSSTYDIKNKDGADYMRFTVYPNDELIYKVMFEQHINQSVTDEEFFPELTYFHIERGVNLLYSEYRLLRNRDKVFQKIMNGDSLQ